MSIQKPLSNSFEQVRAEQLKYNAERETGYRERSLKMYPWICGRCTREFERKNLSELTVHHRDHNHDNSPNVRQKNLHIRQMRRILKLQTTDI